jgi:hypothetical protein
MILEEYRSFYGDEVDFAAGITRPELMQASARVAGRNSSVRGS